MGHKKLGAPEELKNTIRTMEGILEIAVLTIVYYFVFRNGYGARVFPNYSGYGKYVLMGIYALLLFILFQNYESFKFGYLKLTDIVVSQWLSLFIVNFITYWQLCLIANKMISPLPVVVVFVIGAVVAVIMPYMYSVVYHRLYGAHKMLMIYGNNDAKTLKMKMDTRPDKYRITRMICVDEGLEAICREVVNYDSIIINDVPAEIRNDILKFCYENKIRTYITPKISDIIVRGATSINLFDSPLLMVKGAGLNYTQRAVKRLVDIVVCLIAMIVAAPIMLIVAIAIKIEDGGPVFYKQERVTRGGKVFKIMKFRSMIVDAEKNGKAVLAAEHDPRITKVGRFIRATRLDEIPQILNILKGDMSIVGPRPERESIIAEYAKEIPEFSYRLKVKGGLTGYAQIYGKYNTTPYDKLRLDMMYIENYSILLDIKLILMTVQIMLKKESTEGVAAGQENAQRTAPSAESKEEENQKETVSV